MIYARVVDLFGNYEIEDPRIVHDGFLGLMFCGYFAPSRSDGLVEGNVRVRSPRWWACSDDLDELAVFAERMEG